MNPHHVLGLTYLIFKPEPKISFKVGGCNSRVFTWKKRASLYHNSIKQFWWLIRKKSTTGLFNNSGIFVLGNPEGNDIYKHILIQVDIDIWGKWVGIQLVNEVSKMVQHPCERVTNLTDYGFPPHLLKISRPYQSIWKRKKTNNKYLGVVCQECWASARNIREYKKRQNPFFTAKFWLIIAHGVLLAPFQWYSMGI